MMGSSYGGVCAEALDFDLDIMNREKKIDIMKRIWNPRRITVKELISKLEECNPSYEVFINDDNYKYGLVPIDVKIIPNSTNVELVLGCP